MWERRAGIIGARMAIITKALRDQAWRLAGEIVAEYRHQAPMGFDPKAEGAAAVAEADKDGLESNDEFMDAVTHRLGFSISKNSRAGGDKEPADKEEVSGEPVHEGDAGEAAAAGDAAAAAESAEDGEQEAGDGGQEVEQEGTEETEGAEPELTEEEKALVERHVSAATNELQEKVTALETRNAELETAAKTAAPQVSGRVSPLFLTTDAKEIAKTEEGLKQFKAWALKHWDGYEPAEGETGPTYTGAEVREKFAAVDAELNEVIPAARQLMQQRAAWEPVVKKAYPELYDARTPEYKAAQGVLALCPELKQFPNAMMIIGDALRGERARKGAEKQKAEMGKLKSGKAGEAAKAGSKAAAGAAPAKKVAPKVATGASGGAGKPAAGMPNKSKEVSAHNFIKRGGDRNALVQTIMESNLV